MLRRFRLDLSQLTVQPDATRGTVVRPGPRVPKTSAERAAIRAALEVARPFNHTLGGVLDVVDLSVHPPTVTVVPSRAVPIAARSTSELTGGISLTGTAGWVFGLNAAGGVYGSTTLEFGLFSTLGFVAGLFAGAGGGVEYTLVFGTPRDFSGPFVAFQASVGPKFLGGLAIGGSLLFAPGPPGPGGRVPLAFKGFSINGTVGWSELPITVTVEWSNTWTKPLIR